jgi:hexokinase
MSAPGNTMIQFLEKEELLPESVPFDSSVEGFMEEMEKGLKGNPSSLAMIPAWVSAEKSIVPEERVIVLDAGGTNFRAATYSFDSAGNPRVEHFSKSEMPGTSGPISRDRFFRDIAEKMELSVRDSEKIGFCFSYPTDILPNRDGRLIRFTKEVDAPEVEGALIGENLNKAIVDCYGDSGVKPKQITILNDTVATMLAGKVQSSSDFYSGYIGFILGTGTNCAYIERCDNIAGLNAPTDETHMAINMETGGYAGFKGGAVDQRFIASTDKPELFHFEKMVSGAYLGPLGLVAAKAAAEAGHFSSSLARYFEAKKSMPTMEMDNFLHTPADRTHPFFAAFGNDADRDKLFLLFDALIARAAKLAAISLTAVVLKTGEGCSPTHPVAIVADGTTFYKTYGLAERTRCELHRELAGKRGRYVRFLSVDNAPAIGAAVAGLLS